MDEFNLRSLENLAVQIFELVVSFPMTITHLIFKPRQVFETLVHRDDDKQENYGDGKIGYTSPMLFAIAALALQTVADWSMSHAFSTTGMSEKALSANLVVYIGQFFFFAFATALIAARTIERSGEVSTLHKALYVGCYASGIGLFRTIAINMSNLFYFFGSASRAGDHMVFIFIGIAFSCLTVFFALWQLAAFTYGLSIVLSIRKRSALWVIVKAGICSIPLIIFLYLIVSTSGIVAFVRLSSAWEAASTGNYALAIEHLDYLSRMEGFQGSCDSIKLQKLQLKTYCYRKWLPAYERIRLRVEKLRNSIGDEYDRKEVYKELHEVMKSVGPKALSKAPMMVVTDTAELEERLKVVRVRITNHMLTSETKPHWPIPHPIFLTVATTSAMPDKGQDAKSLREELDYLTLCLDVGSMTMLEHLTTVDQQLPANTSNLEPTLAVFDIAVSVMTAIHPLKD